MAKLKYNCRFNLKPNGRVFMRVRWNGGKNETTIALNAFAEAAKWDSARQRAARNTTHTVGNNVSTARLINKEIDKAIDLVDAFFTKIGLDDKIPTNDEVKAVLASLSGTSIPQKQTDGMSVAKLAPLKDIFEKFVADYSREHSWGPKTHYKYQQIWNLMWAYAPNLTAERLGKQFFNELKAWLLENGYKNSSIAKYFRNLKCICHYLRDEGYPVSQECFNYRPNVKVPLKEVIYLKLEEVEQFENFQFPDNRKYLARARDYFCFMCYTSLRYSDLKGLKKASISDNCIDMYAQKTKGRLRIPLVSHARKILERYIDVTPSEYAFAIPSNQKLNEFIREGAKMAGLDREVIDTTFCGTERIETVKKLHEAISCHDARRTFVCLSLALHIPQTVVMSCTGHSDYAAMKPYISISDETSRHELLKWEIGSIRNEIDKILDTLDENQMGQVRDFINENIIK